MKPAAAPSHASGFRHIGLFITTDVHLGRSVLEGFSAKALHHPEWILWPVQGAWREAHKLARPEFDAVVAFMAQPDADKIFRPWWPRVVNVSNRMRFPRFSRVVTDDARVGRMAARHFLDRGFRQFTCVLTRASGLFADLRLQGFRAELRSAGVPPQAVRELAIPADQPSAEQSDALAALIASLPQPVAVFAENDWMALKLRRACWMRGLAVPDQVAILGVDNDPYICQLGNAALSSIELDGLAIGREAAALLEQGFATGDWPLRQILVPPLGVVERASTEHAAAEDPLIRAALQFIRTQAVLGADVDELCQHLAVTRKTLDRRFKAHSGKSPHDLILQRRVEYARRLLRETPDKLEAVAFASGFNDVRTLARAFQRLEGEPPAAYRRRFR